MANKLKDSVSIAGVGCSRFGDLLSTPEIADKTLVELGADAAREALADAGVAGPDVHVREVPPEPEAVQKLYEQCPVPVELDVLDAGDLPVLAFRRS